MKYPVSHRQTRSVVFVALTISVACRQTVRGVHSRSTVLDGGAVMYSSSEHVAHSAQVTPSPQYSPTHSQERSLVAVAALTTTPALASHALRGAHWRSDVAFGAVISYSVAG